VSAAISRYIRHVLDGRDDLSSTARHLLEVLGHIANADGMSWWSVPDLARRMGYVGSDGTPHKMTIRRARRELVEGGLVVFTEARGRGHANLYALPIRAHWCALCDGEKGSPTREKGSPTRAKGLTGEPPSIHKGSMKGPRVTFGNGFALAANGSDEDFSTTTGRVPDILKAIRERRYDDIPEP
jgi:hypothetical protein